MAEPNTLLISDMLERHLFDTIPNAWKALGKSVVPPPISKPVAAKKIDISRRHSVASRSPQTTAPTSSGRINESARRMSTVNQHDMHGDYVDGSKHDGSKQSQKISARRQSVHVDVLKSIAEHVWSDNLPPKSGRNRIAF